MHLTSCRRFVTSGTAAFAVVVGALVVATAPVLDAQKGKPNPDGVGTVTLVDVGPGGVLNGLSSDTGQPYTGATIFAGSGDLRLVLDGTGREILVTLGAPVRQAIASPPDFESFYTDAALFVHDIRSVPKGTTQTRVGRIGFGSALPDRALRFAYTTGQGIVVYGTPLCVTREDVPDAVWTVTSSCAGEAATADTSTKDDAGLFEENLKGKINHKFEASYVVPFQFTVTCTAGCS